MPVHQLTSLGAYIFNRIEAFGAFTQFCATTMQCFVFGIRQWSRPNLLLPLLYQIGTRSTPVIMLVGAFIGMVLAVEVYSEFEALGQEQRIGSVINISVVKQIGPVLAAVMLAGRVGGAVSAELGTMRVTEQIDAMRAMGVDPIAHLVIPRVFACVTMIPLLTIFSDMLGIYGGYTVTVRGFGVSADAYWQYSAQYIAPYDLFTGLVKSLFFGLAIGLISCYKGLNCRSGAAGVGQAATDAFVTSFVAIIISNFFLAGVMRNLYILIVGPSEPSAFGG